MGFLLLSSVIEARAMNASGAAAESQRLDLALWPWRSVKVNPSVSRVALLVNPLMVPDSDPALGQQVILGEVGGAILTNIQRLTLSHIENREDVLQIEFMGDHRLRVELGRSCDEAGFDCVERDYVFVDLRSGARERLSENLPLSSIRGIRAYGKAHYLVRTLQQGCDAYHLIKRGADGRITLMGEIPEASLGYSFFGQPHERSGDINEIDGEVQVRAAVPGPVPLNLFQGNAYKLLRTHGDRFEIVDVLDLGIFSAVGQAHGVQPVLGSPDEVVATFPLSGPSLYKLPRMPKEGDRYASALFDPPLQSWSPLELRMDQREMAQLGHNRFVKTDDGLVSSYTYRRSQIYVVLQPNRKARVYAAQSRILNEVIAKDWIYGIDAESHRLRIIYRSAAAARAAELALPANSTLLWNFPGSRLALVRVGREKQSFAVIDRWEENRVVALLGAYDAKARFAVESDRFVVSYPQQGERVIYSIPHFKEIAREDLPCDDRLSL